MKVVKPRFTNRLLRLFTPHYIAESVEDIKRNQLPVNIKAVAFDVDSTIIAHGKHNIEEKTLRYLHSFPLPIHIATNRLQKSASIVARHVNANSVTFATKLYRKPQKAYFKKLSVNSGVSLSNLTMVGDRIFTDIYGANKSGMTTVYVKALGEDPWYMRYTGIRYLENKIVQFLGHK